MIDTRPRVRCEGMVPRINLPARRCSAQIIFDVALQGVPLCDRCVYSDDPQYMKMARADRLWDAAEGIRRQ